MELQTARVLHYLFCGAGLHWDAMYDQGPHRNHHNLELVNPKPETLRRNSEP